MKNTILLIIIAIALIIIVVHQLSKRFNQKKSPDSKAPEGLYSINDGNQDTLIYFIDYDEKWFEELDQKYSWDNFNSYDNRYYEYMYKLFDELPKQRPEGETRLEFFNKLTRGQKIFFSELVFGGEVDNGGVYQFFFNKPEFSLAILESFEELKLMKLKEDYEKCLNELLGSVDKLKQRKESFNDESQDWEKRWNSFTAGYTELPSAQVIEDYFYTEENKKLRYKTMVDYIDNHITQFVKK